MTNSPTLHLDPWTIVPWTANAGGSGYRHLLTGGAFLGGLSYDPARKPWTVATVAAALKALPPGKRILSIQNAMAWQDCDPGAATAAQQAYNGNAYFDLGCYAGDAIPDPGQGGKLVQGFWVAAAAAVINLRAVTFFDALRDAGAVVDLVVSDDEVGLPEYDWQPDDTGHFAAALRASYADPRMAALQQRFPAAFPQGQAPKASWYAPSRANQNYQNMTRANHQLNTDAFNAAYFGAVRAAFPDVTIWDYLEYASSQADAIACVNGYSPAYASSGQYQWETDGTGSAFVGDAQTPQMPFYGQPPFDPSRAFQAIKFFCNRIRAARRQCPLIPVVPWLTYESSEPLWFANPDWYREYIWHAMLESGDKAIFWGAGPTNPAVADSHVIDDAMDTLSALAGGRPITPLPQALAPYAGTNILWSAARTDTGRVIGRATANPGPLAAKSFTVMGKTITPVWDGIGEFFSFDP